jgi:TonB family protein
MFDKLVESDTTGAEFKNRSRYFMVSTVVVGILFLTAVIYSLYAAEIGLVNGNFEIAEFLSPVDTTVPETEEQPDRTPIDRSSDDRLSRRILMEDTTSSTRIPISVSAEKNPFKTLSPDKFKGVKISDVDSDGPGNVTAGRTCNGNCSGSSSPATVYETDAAETKTPPPPAIRSKPAVLKTSNVLNGSAISLPKPPYPQPAIILNLQGSVRVQVTIDETGNVISAKAADGHPLFRQVAEQAARTAKFRPTLLNDAPVKVTGVIVYNFKRN